ncbi:hypothetical protein IQ07DRAFT_586953 [Pyrenochaeta sp. DS3sAY3a]|nr:hypothetical protein IQ07DRAFT_586953 [Pyrenochaeta sp. DS3sAY3a]
MTSASRSFNDLPDELLQAIIINLSVIHSYEPQSTAFKDQQKEIARQRENRTRQLALHSLCLTSHHLRRIATPILYESCVGSATVHGLEQLELFHRTISSPNNALGLDVRLAEYIKYVENRLGDYLGNTLYDDIEFHSDDRMPAVYFYILSEIINHATNLRHLSVVSIETHEVSLWNYILPPELGTWAPSPLTHEAPYILNHIQTLCFQIHTGSFSHGPDAAWFRRICQSISPFSALSDLRASGIESSGLPSYSVALFGNLRRLEITECSLTFIEVLDIWLTCEGLRHIVCEWTYLDCEYESPSTLYTGLRAHKETLETLVLDLREVRFYQITAEEPKILGTLDSFPRLRSLAISDAALLGHGSPILDFPTIVQQDRIAELLPKNLTSLVMLLRSHYGYDIERNFDDVVSFWDLAQDVGEHLPKLKDITFKTESSVSQLVAPGLEKAFNDAGVQFDVQTSVPPVRFE